MAVVSGLHRYVDTGRSPLAWMFGIAANKVNEANRAGGRRRESPVDVAPDRGDDDEHRPDLVACQLETTRELAARLGALPAPQGEILRLRIAAGLSADETAEVLGMSAGAVRVAQHRALRRLRKRFQDGGRDELA